MGALSGLRVLDLSRVFAGPFAAQMLADYGADVIKIERPGRGDDVRQQGVRAKRPDGTETRETSSFLSMNRGKRSVTLDMAKPEGQALVRELAAQSDILIENFKAGDLVRYGLDYASLKAVNPRLIYCSITGFGQTGPAAHLPGYDPIFQAMSGFMMTTGNPIDTPGGGPMRTGLAAGDINGGLYAVTAILAALHHRDGTGEGQHIDIALFDAQVAALAHLSMIYLLTGEQPPLLGNASPITCPYQPFPCSDGQIMITIGNDSQFVKFCEILGHPEWSSDERFVTNPQRARHRTILVPMIEAVMAGQTVHHWHRAFDDGGVPSGPINNFEQSFAHPQIVHREMLMEMDHATAGKVPQVANPVRFSATPVEYERAPPALGQHTEEVLRDVLKLDAARIRELAEKKLI